MNYYKIVDELCFNDANVELADKDKRTPMNIGNSSKLQSVNSISKLSIILASTHARYSVEDLLKSYEKI